MAMMWKLCAGVYAIMNITIALNQSEVMTCRNLEVSLGAANPP